MMDFNALLIGFSSWVLMGLFRWDGKRVATWEKGSSYWSQAGLGWAMDFYHKSRPEPNIRQAKLFKPGPAQVLKIKDQAQSKAGWAHHTQPGLLAPYTGTHQGDGSLA